MKKSIVFCLFATLLLYGCTNKGNADEKEETPHQYSPSLIATVKDLTAPKINCKDRYEIIIGETFDLKKEVKVTDNTDKSPTLTVSGKLNLSKAGTYTLELTAKDKDNNISHKKITIVVSEKKSTPKKDTQKNEEKQSSNSDKQNNQSQSNGIQSIPTEEKDDSRKQYENKQNEEIIVSASEKDFLFEDGKTFDDTYEECMSYGRSIVSSKKANMAECGFIKDKNDDDIFIGYHLYLY